LLFRLPLSGTFKKWPDFARGIITSLKSGFGCFADFDFLRCGQNPGGAT
jgi:hypothetical protein